MSGTEPTRLQHLFRYTDRRSNAPGQVPLTRLPYLLCLDVILLTLCAVAYAAGVYQTYRNLWPVPFLKTLVSKEQATGPIQTDAFGRLRRYPGKVELACPTQDATTAVLFVFGQSNAANYQGQQYQGIDNRVVNFAEGRCYVASSPLLGADGRAGESWTLLGNKLIASKLYSNVVLVPAGVGNSSVLQWAPGGNLNQMLRSVIQQAKTRYTITALLWHQGTTDLSHHTPEEAYKAALKGVGALSWSGDVRMLFPLWF